MYQSNDPVIIIRLFVTIVKITLKTRIKFTLDIDKILDNPIGGYNLMSEIFNMVRLITSVNRG